MLLLDVHLKQCYTFMHYVEEQIHVPFRYMKSFRMSYIDRNGAESSRCYRMFVRDLAIDSDPFEPDEFLLKSGIMVEGMWLDIPVRVIDMAESYSIYENDLLNNKGKMCYIFSGYELDWENKQTHPDDLNH